MENILKRKDGKTDRRSLRNQRGEKNPFWKGDSVGYYGVHRWIETIFGKPKFCEKCKSTKEKWYDWANISGEYKRDKNDWMRLCRKCHMLEDKRMNNLKQYQKKIVRGFTCGQFDLTHAGHYMMFEECRKQCDKLIVGLQVDSSVDRPEKHKPIQTLEERLIQVGACKWVDDVIIYRTEDQLVELIKLVNPHIRFLGEDWKDKEFTGKDLPVKVVFNSRKHNYSTTNLIKRVKEI